MKYGIVNSLIYHWACLLWHWLWSLNEGVENGGL